MLTSISVRSENLSKTVYTLSRWNLERIKLYISWYMEANKSFLSFHSRLTAQAPCCNWTEQEECSVVRDLFIGRIRDSNVQSTLIRKKSGSCWDLKAGAGAGERCIYIYGVSEVLTPQQVRFFFLQFAQNKTRANILSSIASGRWSIFFPKTKYTGQERSDLIPIVLLLR